MCASARAIATDSRWDTHPILRELSTLSYLKVQEYFRKGCLCKERFRYPKENRNTQEKHTDFRAFPGFTRGVGEVCLNTRASVSVNIQMPIYGYMWHILTLCLTKLLTNTHQTFWEYKSCRISKCSQWWKDKNEPKVWQTWGPLRKRCMLGFMARNLNEGVSRLLCHWKKNLAYFSSSYIHLTDLNKRSFSERFSTWGSAAYSELYYFWWNIPDA